MADLGGGEGVGGCGENAEAGGDQGAGGERERGERGADAHTGSFLLVTVLTVRQLWCRWSKEIVPGSTRQSQRTKRKDGRVPANTVTVPGTLGSSRTSSAPISIDPRGAMRAASRRIEAPDGGRRGPVQDEAVEFPKAAAARRGRLTLLNLPDAPNDHARRGVSDARP
ncbi:hypothetical protein GCM10010449_10590 [Streptomyces rectiviolaceus]|uniref:Uncharacterized protein n=1 Tax=Streptomyces rectiviolaceus TaxID=332591 RepID=A0ABP6M8D2_9ACTN